MIELLVAGAVFAFAVVQASRSSTSTVVLLVLAVVLSRFVRRVIDWSGNEYSSETLISLLALLIAVAMGLSVVASWRRFSKTVQGVVIAVSLAILYGFLVGVGNGIAAAYAAAQYIACVLVFLFILYLRPSPATVDGWVRFCVFLAVAVAIYGWWQFLFLPPWDATWMKWCGMNSIGKPEPLKLRAFKPVDFQSGSP